MVNISLIVWIVASIIFSLALIIRLGSDKISSKAFSNSIFWVSIWIAGVAILTSTRSAELALYVARINYLMGDIIAISFLIFFLSYPENHNVNKIYQNILTLLSVALGIIFIFTEGIISTVNLSTTGYWRWDFGPISFVFEFIFGFCFVFGILILLKKLIRNIDIKIRSNIKFMLLTIVTGSIPATIMCIILPRLGYFKLNWLGAASEIIWIPIISYSIIKYKQMDVKAVIAELLAVGMTLLFFINIFTDINSNVLLKIATLILFIIFSLYLFKSIIHEVNQQESLRILNLTLEQKVAEQTAEVKKAFEMEKGVRRELEKLNETKDQFIMITQHNLRTPVTSIRWETEALMKGERGAINEEAMTSIRNIDICTRRLLRLVDDFLNITAIRTGSEILEISRANMKTILEQVLSELKIDIGNMNINITYPKDDRNWPEIDVDISKIHEVVLIIIENAIRYNRKDGEIKISTERSVKNMHGHESEVLQVFVENTGVGITKEERNNLFTRLFYRSKKAQDTHPIGMGIGLSVARAIVRAHRGEITIESPGENMGATVTVTLPFLNDSRKHHSLPQ